MKIFEEKFRVPLVALFRMPPKVSGVFVWFSIHAGHQNSAGQVMVCSGTFKGMRLGLKTQGQARPCLPAAHTAPAEPKATPESTRSCLDPPGNGCGGHRAGKEGFHDDGARSIPSRRGKWPDQAVAALLCSPTQILENTPENHPDHSHLKHALEKAEELCSQVNEGVREKENSDRLEWIQAHVQCEGLSEVVARWPGPGPLADRGQAAQEG